MGAAVAAAAVAAAGGAGKGDGIDAKKPKKSKGSYEMLKTMVRRMVMPKKRNSKDHTEKKDKSRDGDGNGGGDVGGGGSADGLAAFILDTRCSIALPLVVRHTLAVLGPVWSLYFYHGPRNERCVKEALADVRGEIAFVNIGADFVDDAVYNTIMKSNERVWHRLRRDGVGKVLVFQADSVVLHGNITEFFQWDYVSFKHDHYWYFLV